MLELVTITAGLASILGGITAKAAEVVSEKALETGCDWLSGEVLVRAAGHFGMATNHDAEKAVRRAQMASLRCLLNAYAKQVPLEDEDRQFPPLFIDAAFAFADRATRRCEGAASEAKAEVIGRVVASLDAALGAVQAKRLADRATALRAVAEQAAFAEFEAEITARADPKTGETLVVPEGFRRLFFEGLSKTDDAQQVVGWYDGFILFAAKALKGSDEPFRKIYAATRLAGIAELSRDSNEGIRAVEAGLAGLVGNIRGSGQALARLEAVLAQTAVTQERMSGQLASIKGDTTAVREQQALDGETLDAIGDDVKALREEMRALQALARQSGRFDYAAQEGIPEAAVRATVERLGGEGIDRDNLIPWLDNWIEAARRELGRRTNEGEAFEAARQEAARRFRAGRLKEASGAFMDEFARERQQLQERQEESKHRSLRLLEEAIRFDALAFDGEAAAAKLRTMAEIEGIAGADALGGWLFDKAVEFYESGDRQGDNAALLVAIATYHAALAEFARKCVPLDWATTQNNLGNALSRLGERESGTVRLEEAVSAYRSALEERSRERVPLDWAMTQNNLGTALS